jgi:hypothetical protein
VGMGLAVRLLTPTLVVPIPIRNHHTVMVRLLLLKTQPSVPAQAMPVNIPVSLILTLVLQGTLVVRLVVSLILGTPTTMNLLITIFFT